MATTEYPVNHPLAVKAWAKRLYVEALKETFASRFMGTGTDSLISVKNELSKGPGDRITQGLRMQLLGAGVSGDGTLEGNEEALQTYSDNIFIDQLRHAVRSAGRMSQQRVTFDIRDEAMSGLRDWWADRIDTGFFNQICGYTAQTDTRYTGMNSAVAPSRHIIPDSPTTSHTAEVSLSTTQTFQLAYIDRAVTVAKTGTTGTTPILRPIRVNGADKYVMFLHPFQTFQLRTDATSGRITWFDAQRSRVQGGEMDNPIYNGALGEYNNVILHESTRVTYGVTSAAAETDVRRAVLCGAQAALMATGQDNSPTKMTWEEELFDYGNQLGVSAGMIWGLKKAVFNSTDFATIVVSSYSPAVS